MYYSVYGQTVFLSEFKVAFVVSGNAHNRAGAVRFKHVIRYINRYFFAVYGVNRVSADKYACFFARGRKTFDFVDFSRIFNIVFDCLFLFGSAKFFNQIVLGGEYYVRNAENRVGAGGKHSEAFAVFGFEFYFAADRFAYPVALHGFGLFWPIEPVQVAQKFFGIVRDFKEPLS